ncbi:translocation/assembly module TamB domain-containing protein [Ectopseudomonas alcaliphila]|uniref:translocation/assembly module TamB domain-containing protein n=1 Tax=Ectopseudomonas alcaliphila TaxID=101564 RepID=UPI002781EEAA|nr:MULTISPECIES: translocation/assembly module TamB domain-containing protein [Pseudomonas]MDP9940392.1 translocation and assembly module TamB [Pseudomonas sp. 3400]MDR7012042.1 translocation and assembly module TamB [Pseudomonas alcaliphila]
MTRRLLKWIAAALLGLVLLLIAALWALLGTQDGSRWLLAKVPGLQVDNFNGRLGGAWQVDALVWQQDELRVELQQLDMAWSPSCLLRLTLCIDRLHLQQAALNVPQSGETSSEPLSLPSLNLPLRLQLGDIQLGELRLDGQAQLSDLELIASWNEQGVDLQRLALQRDDLRLDVSGRLTPQGNWPLALSGRLQLPEVDGKSWQVALQIGGELQGSLELDADSSGYLDARLQGKVQALAEHLPAELRLTSRDFQASSALPPTLRLQELQLQAKGDLASGYRIEGTANLPAEQAPMPLQLRGRVDATGADIELLRIQAEAQHLQLEGKLAWSEDFSVDAQLEWLDFPWQRLYPLDEPLPVALRTLKAEVSYSAGNYLGNFVAQLRGPAGDFSLSSPVSGDLGQVSLPQLQLIAGQGRAEGVVKVGFAEGIDWQAMLQLSDLDPGYWLAEMPGNLAGPLNTSGSFNAGALQARADIDLNGRLRGQPAQLQVQGVGAGEQWQLQQLLVRLGDNRVSGQGALDQRLRGQLELALPRLGQLWPGLHGQMQGQLSLAGTLQAPQGQFALSGERLAFGDPSLRRLQLDATLDARQQARIGLNLRGIRIGDTYLGRLQADGRGDQRRQALDIDLQGPLLQLALALDGNLSEQGDWRGRIASGRIQSGGQDWQLQQAASLERLTSGRLNLGAHCWQSGDASLCGGQQRLMPQPSLDWRLENFPLASLQPWLPEDFAWQGRLDGQLTVDIPDSGPTGQVRLDAGAGNLRIRQPDEEQWLDFPYDSLRLDSTLRPQRVDSELRFVSARLGELVLQAQIDPRPANKPVNGEFRLSGFDLAVLRPFVPMAEKLEGKLQGSGNINGHLLAPQINGQLRLDDGELSGSELPVSLEGLQLRALIAGEQVQLSGDWRSGEQGRGNLRGELNWAEGLSGDLRLQGQRLPVKVEPYAELEVEPDLQLQLRAQRLAVSGKVGVPRGLISVRELPPSTVRVSGDARVVGRDVPEAEQGLGVAMDVDVEVGQDKLAFSGFGLSADLRGRVHIGDNLDTRGELDLVNGRYRAYGQRLTIRRARLLFTGPIDQPFLDVEAIRRVDTVVAGIRLSGSAEQPSTTVFAEPAMSQEQALSYLILGRPLGQSAGDNNMLGQAALALGLAGSSSLTSSLANSLGIQDFQLDTEGSGVTTSVVASGNITERLSLRYGVGVFEPANTIALRYELSRRLYLEAASGLASSLDLFYRRDF